MRDGRVNLKDGFASVEGGELWLYNVHISPYEKGTIYNKDPLRPRKLLVHKTDIRRLVEKTREKGFTLVPLKMYLKEGRWAKIELAVAKGKQLHDKRDSAGRTRRGARNRQSGTPQGSRRLLTRGPAARAAQHRSNPPGTTGFDSRRRVGGSVPRMGKPR